MDVNVYTRLWYNVAISFKMNYVERVVKLIVKRFVKREMVRSSQYGKFVSKRICAVSVGLLNDYSSVLEASI